MQDNQTTTVNSRGFTGLVNDKCIANKKYYKMCSSRDTVWADLNNSIYVVMVKILNKQEICQNTI